jgi:hypothetical protein
MKPIYIIYIISYFAMAMFIAYGDYPQMSIETATASEFIGMAGIVYLVGYEK